MKIKTFLAIVLALVCSLSLFACDKSAEFKKDYNFSVNATEIELETGDTFSLVAVYSDKTIKFETVDDKVATVDEKGTVTAKGLGETVIKISVDGLDLVKYCKVTVAEYEYTVEFKMDNNYPIAKNAERILEVVTLKDGVEYKGEVTWSVSGGASITADGMKAVFKASDAGEYQITATSKEGGNVTLTVKVVDGFNG